MKKIKQQEKQSISEKNRVELKLIVERVYYMLDFLNNTMNKNNKNQAKVLIFYLVVLILTLLCGAKWSFFYTIFLSFVYALMCFSIFQKILDSDVITTKWKEKSASSNFFLIVLCSTSMSLLFLIILLLVKKIFTIQIASIVFIGQLVFLIHISLLSIPYFRHSRSNK